MEGARRVKFDATKDMQSPRFRAIIRATSGRRKRATCADVKSFSHELNGNGPHRLPIWKLRGISNPEDVMKVVRTKFDKLKEEVDSELGIFAGVLVDILEKDTNEHPEWKVSLEDLLIISRQCAEMSSNEFWLKCEGIVQKLDDKRQELPMGILKQAHTRILFILTRCTRLLQFQKDGAFADGGKHVLGLHQLSDLGVYPEQSGSEDSGRMLKSLLSTKDLKEKIMSRARMSSWKKLPSAAEKNQKKNQEKLDIFPPKKALDSTLDKMRLSSDAATSLPDSTSTCSHECANIQQYLVQGKSTMICRICDYEIPTLNAEGHFRVCTISDRCDMKGLTINQRLERIAEMLEKVLGSRTPKSFDNIVGHIYNTGDSNSPSIPEEHDWISPSQANLNRPSPADIMDSSSEADNSVMTNELSSLSSILCSPVVPPPDQGALALSSGSITPQSPLFSPRNSQVELLLNEKNVLNELENFQQIQSLLSIVRQISSVNDIDYTSLESLSSHLEDLNAVIDNRKVDALVVETFGRRIEKLLQEKFVQLCTQIEDENKDTLYTVAEEDNTVEAETAHTKTSHMGKKIKDRTSIEDFEIIKPISRGAFGRVFLAKKRITGDLFAIKVLKKADMIRKNAVESILAERNILISVRNPFVVRFFYSFTCKENLYLVMEYLNGGDLYSLLRNLGCLDEEMARLYIAELVLALEYLHSLNVIHRDLKPDNLLIARDGHIKMTDFGLSKVGLINSTDDLSVPDISSSVTLAENEPMQAKQPAKKRELRQKQSAVGTPDYLAPEILLGMAHGPTADWWSVGVILFELLVGIPPFNAEHPQKIFDNIMNRDIPWPQAPDEVSSEARDLIDKLLIENPLQRLGATGAAEVKSHPFFTNINWEMLARQKAAFVPSTEGDDDTSYFACRHAWSASDNQIHAATESDETDTMSCCSSQLTCEQDEDGDEYGSLTDFETPSAHHYTFSNFSFKNITQLASINYDVITKGKQDSEDISNP